MTGRLLTDYHYQHHRQHVIITTADPWEKLIVRDIDCRVAISVSGSCLIWHCMPAQEVSNELYSFKNTIVIRGHTRADSQSLICENVIPIACQFCYTCTRMHAHAPTHPHKHAHAGACTRRCTHTHGCTHTYTHQHTHTHAHTHTHTHARTHARTYVRTHARTHAHTHTHTTQVAHKTIFQ